MNRFHFVVGLTMLALCAGLQAQTAMTANIPFEFQVGKTQMPAGEYNIHYSQGLVTLRQYPNSAVLALTRPVSRKSPPETGVLQFHRYGDVYFLARIWTPFSADGGELHKTAREAELARQNGAGQTTLVVASRK